MPEDQTIESKANAASARFSSRGARPPSGAVGCAPRPRSRNFHRPSAAFFPNRPAMRVAVRPRADALPETFHFRESLERMLNRGKIDQSLSRMIIDGTPFVSVEIFRDPSGTPYITFTPFE